MCNALPKIWLLTGSLLLVLWCADAPCEPMEVDFNNAIERCIAYFPMLAGHTCLTMRIPSQSAR